MASCLVAAYARRDRNAASQVASEAAVRELFDRIAPKGAFIKADCYSNDLCGLRWEQTCATAFFTRGRMDAQFFFVEEVTVGCSAGREENEGS